MNEAGLMGAGMFGVVLRCGTVSAVGVFALGWIAVAMTIRRTICPALGARVALHQCAQTATLRALSASLGRRYRLRLTAIVTITIDPILGCNQIIVTAVVLAVVIVLIVVVIVVTSATGRHAIENRPYDVGPDLFQGISRPLGLRSSGVSIN